MSAKGLPQANYSCVLVSGVTRVGKTDVKRSTSTPVRARVVRSLRRREFSQNGLCFVSYCNARAQKWCEKFDMQKLPSREVVRAARRAAWLLQLRVTPDQVQVCGALSLTAGATQTTVVTQSCARARLLVSVRLCRTTTPATCIDIARVRRRAPLRRQVLTRTSTSFIASGARHVAPRCASSFTTRIT